jgi:Helix-turn-helix domain
MGTRRRRRADRAGRPPMRSPGRRPVGRREHKQRFWAAIARRQSSEEAGITAGVSPAVGVRWFRDSGGMAPITLAPLSGRYLSVAEREEIALLRARGWRVRDIARQLGRSPSTISRELRRNATTRGGRLEYRARLSGSVTLATRLGSGASSRRRGLTRALGCLPLARAAAASRAGRVGAGTPGHGHRQGSCRPWPILLVHGLRAKCVDFYQLLLKEGADRSLMVAERSAASGDGWSGWSTAVAAASTDSPGDRSGDRRPGRSWRDRVPPQLEQVVVPQSSFHSAWQARMPRRRKRRAPCCSLIWPKTAWSWCRSSVAATAGGARWLCSPGG